MRSLVQKFPGLRWRTGTPQKRVIKRQHSLPWLVILCAILLTIFVGMVTALGAFKITIALAGLLVAAPILFLVNTRVMLPLLFVLVFLVQGTAEYFFKLRLATWMATMFCALFFVRALLELSVRPKLPQAVSRAGGGRVMLAAGVVYLLFYFFSLATGRGNILQVISAIRFCLPMFGVLFALYWFEWSEQRLTQFWWLMTGIMVLQVPIVTYQHFFLISVSGWDGVNGSFGFGMSAMLVLFCLGCIMYALSRWSRGLSGVPFVMFVSAVATFVILMGEVKAILFWLPFGIFWVVRRRALRNVIAFMTFACLSVVFMGGTYTAYKTMYWGAAHGKDDTLGEKFDSISAYVIDPNNINYKTGEVSRGASLMLWYKDLVPTTMERLVGYGPGASAISSATGLGVVAKRYQPLGIAATAVATLLWDVGLSGTIAYLTFLVAGIVTGIRFVRRGRASAPVLCAVDTSTGILVLLLSTTVYNRALIDEPTVQLFCFFCLGTIAQCARFHERWDQVSQTPAPRAALQPVRAS